MKFFKTLICCLPLVALGGNAMAQDATFRNTFYIGGGSAKTDKDFENDDTAVSIGFLRQAANSNMVWGFDIAREGTKLDSTWGYDEKPKQAMSFNLLIGSKLVENGRFQASAAVLLGIRESAQECATSYLGYQCWADQDPEVDYKGNFGAVLALSYNRMTLGLRATGESTQLIAGMRF